MSPRNALFRITKGAKHFWLAAIRFAVGGILVISALSKMRHPFLFLSEVYDYAMFGRTSGFVIALLLPFIELLVGGCLVFGVFLRGAFTVAAVLTAIFLFVLSSAIQRQLDITCGCFSGASMDKIGYDTVIRTGFLFVLAMLGTIGAFWPNKSTFSYFSRSITNFQSTEISHAKA